MFAGKTPWLGSGPARLSLWRSGSSTTEGHKEKGTVTFSTSLWGLHPGSGLGAGARASTISTADEIQSDPQTQMSTMFAWAGFRLGISYEAELRCLRPEIRTSGTRVLCGCPVLRLRVGGAVGRSSCCLPLVAGILDRGSSACDHGRTDSFFFLDLSVLSNPVPALGPAFRSHVTRVRDSSLFPTKLATDRSRGSQARRREKGTVTFSATGVLFRSIVFRFAEGQRRVDVDLIDYHWETSCYTER